MSKHVQIIQPEPNAEPKSIVLLSEPVQSETYPDIFYQDDTDSVDSDKYSSENDACDQISICDLSDIPKLLRLTHRVPQEERDYHILKEKRADPAIFYPVTDETNLKKRFYEISRLKHPVEEHHRKDPFPEAYVEIQYLNLRPVTFFIVGKPEVGQTEVARVLSARWNCVNLNPRTVVEDEIRLQTRIGKCFEFSLKYGRTIAPDVILRLIEKRVKTQTAEHRGFVLSGFPIIEDFEAMQVSLITESAMSVVAETLENILPSEETLDKIIRKKRFEPVERKPKEVVFKKRFVEEVAGEFLGEELLGEKEEDKLDEELAVAEEENLEGEDMEEALPEEESIDVLYQRDDQEWIQVDDMDLGDTDDVLIHEREIKLWEVAAQMEFLFNLCGNTFVMVCMSCDNLDAIELRLNAGASRQVESKRTVVFSASTSILVAPKIVKMNPRIATPVPRSLVTKQIREYNQQALPVIEQRALEMNRDFFIKIDARLSPTRIVEIILTRLKILGLPPVVIPELLKLPEAEQPGEIDESVPYCKRLAPEDYFDTLRYQSVINPVYRLQLSNWNYKCPVSAKCGKILKGKADKAVKYMNKIFFLANDEALLNFCRNPRPYIRTMEKLPFKVWIMGPEWSGRTMLAERLSHSLNAVLIKPEHLKRKYIKRKRQEFTDQVSSKALEEGKNALRTKIEEERKLLITDWMIKATELLKEALTFHSRSSQASVQVPTDGTTTPRDNDDINKLLFAMNLPEFEDVKTIYYLLENAEELAKYLPYTLTESVKEVDVFHPLIVSYIENVLRDTIHPEVEITPEIYADITKQEITRLENDHHRIFEKKPSLIVDGMPGDMEILQQFDFEAFPDYTVCLKDDDPVHEFLIDRLFNDENGESRQLKRLLQNIRKQDPKGSVLRRNLRKEQDNSGNLRLGCDVDVKSQITKTYTENIDRFNNSWPATKEYFRQRCHDPPIEVDVTNKSHEEIFEEVSTSLENKFRETPVLVTEEAKRKEKEDFINSMRSAVPAAELLGEGETEFGSEDAETDKLDELYLESRRFGNTGRYCPVAFNVHSVLWKGKEEFSAKFKERLYFLSSQEALETFLKSPYKLLKPFYIPAFPPARIVIIGTKGSGKTTLAQHLAKETGLCYFNIETMILYLMNVNNCSTISDALASRLVELEPRQFEVLSDYLTGDGRVSETIVHIILNMVWRNEPYTSAGFVLDGFPPRKTEIDLMISHYFIPDVIIELYATQNDVQSRLYAPLLAEWEEEIRVRKYEKEIENSEVYNKWKYNRCMQFDFLMKVKREARIKSAQEAAKKRLLPSPVSSKASLTSLDGEYDEFLNTYNYTEDEENEDMLEVEELLKTELPEPQFDEDWESATDAADRIRTEIDERYLKEIAGLDLMRSVVLHENIEHALIVTSGKSTNDIASQVLEIVARYKNRDLEIFEDTREISVTLAENLLRQSYYFLSKFGRLCPVQVFEKTNPIHMYLPAERMNMVRTLLHRRYIYFLNGDENRDKFKRDPVKYVTNDEIEFAMFPVRLAIIGPPKCGKSTVAARFGDEFGLQVITRGSAIRYVLNRFPEAELAKNMRYVLEQGWCVTDEMVIRAVEAVTLDGLSVYQGFVFDGFPNSIGELQHMATRNLIPFVVLDIEADLEKLRECTEARAADAACAYTVEYTTTTHSYWSRNSVKVRDWLRKQYQNIYTLDSSKSKWYVWDQAREILFSALLKFQHYLKQSKYNRAHLVNSFCITSQEFLGRESTYQNYCPCCLHANQLYYRESSPDWRNIVLYGNFYYAICSEHLKYFLREPHKYTLPINKAVLPKHLPVIVTEINPEKLHQGGFCIVTFWDSMPEHVLVKGDPNVAVRYRKRFCLFCSEACRDKFMRTPHAYFEKKIHFRQSNVIPMCDLNQLPTMGYLEQFVAQQLIDALARTEADRPFCPGLGVELSAIISIGLYLKLHNPRTRKEELPFVEEAVEKFLERARVFKKALYSFKSRKNPFRKVLVPRAKCIDW